ncbi:MAG TPA: nuclear transport factor 2 family protein [Bacteroidota bacterium]
MTLCWGLTPDSLSQPAGEDVRAIRKVLEDQVAAWNRGDVEGYMKGYWNSDSTLFVSGGTLTKGYGEVLTRYRKGYDSRDKMGVLSFRDLAIKQLSPAAALVTGVWNLERKSDNPRGRFTLILEKKSEGWRITLDHTSSAEH